MAKEVLTYNLHGISLFIDVQMTLAQYVEASIQQSKEEFVLNAILQILYLTNKDASQLFVGTGY